MESKTEFLVPKCEHTEDTINIDSFDVKAILKCEELDMKQENFTTFKEDIDNISVDKNDFLQNQEVVCIKKESPIDLEGVEIKLENRLIDVDTNDLIGFDLNDEVGSCESEVTVSDLELLNVPENSDDVLTDRAKNLRDAVKKIRKFKCCLCDYKTIYRDTFKIHRLQHFKVKTHNCNMCSYGCFTSAELKKHIARKHSNKQKSHKEFKCDDRPDAEKPYKCHKCSFSGLCERSLKIHEKVHLRKRFSCDKCFFHTTKEKVFLNHQNKHRQRNNVIAEYVINGMNTNVSDTNKHKCTKCNYSSRYYALLLTHMDTHKD